MIQIVLLLALVAISVFGILLVYSFRSMSLAELKRQARKNNSDAARVYPVRAYGLQLWLLLWGPVCLAVVGAILLLQQLMGSWSAWALASLIGVLSASVLPWIRWPSTSLRLAANASPVVEKILRFTFPVLKWPDRWLHKLATQDKQIVIHSRDELVDILRHNAKQFTHVRKEDLNIAKNALTYGDLLVGDHMTPVSAVQFIGVTEQLTPIVLDELHKSGHSRVPVFQDTNQHIVGTLYVKDALRARGSQSVAEVMRHDVFYVNEQATLEHALRGFLRTKHHMFVVVNEFEDVVGILTIEDVLEQIIGVPIQDEFDQFDDMRAVAAHAAALKHKNHTGEHI